MRQFTAPILATLVLTLAVGCGTDPAVAPPPTPTPLATAVLPTQDDLAIISSFADAVTYDVLSFQVNATAGGSFQGVASSWQAAYPDHVFGLEVPPVSWDPLEFGSDLTLEVWVPHLDTDFEGIEYFVFELHAVGIEHMVFSAPVRLTFSFHPSQVPSCGAVRLYNYGPRPGGGFWIQEAAVADPSLEGLPNEAGPHCQRARNARIHHFSRWAVKKGSGDEEPDPDPPPGGGGS